MNEETKKYLKRSIRKTNKNEFGCDEGCWGVTMEGEECQKCYELTDEELGRIWV